MESSTNVFLTRQTMVRSPGSWPARGSFLVLCFHDAFHAWEASVPSRHALAAMFDSISDTHCEHGLSLEKLVFNPVTVKHSCTTRLQADPMFSGNGCQLSVILQPARLHTEPACRWAWTEVEENSGFKRCSQHSQYEILTCFEEFQMEMPSRMMSFQALCHAWKGSPPWSVKHNLLWLIRPSLWGKYLVTPCPSTHLFLM